jgi:dipeptidyl aminopeptidase/acylaminoacyl peptidase
MFLNNPTCVYLYNLDNKTFKKINDYEPEITKISNELPIDNEIIIKAKDGLKLPCYFTKPINKNNNKIPLIVFIPGGPGVATRQNFNAFAKIFSLYGYAVIRINYRFTAINIKHKKTANGEFGKKMISDIHDVVDYLISNENIDKNNIGLYGHSYGGIASLQTIIKRPKFYKFAIIYNARIDLKKNKEIKEKNMGENKMFFSIYGKTILNPIEHMDKFKLPILIIRGGKDTQGEKEDDNLIFYNNVKKYNNKIKLLYYENEGHGIYNYNNFNDMWKNIIEFIKKYK